MPKPATHILFSYPKEKGDPHSLYRANGLHLAYQQGNTVIFGNDPNPALKQHRIFLDERYAMAHLRDMADMDASGFPMSQADWLGTAAAPEVTHQASIEERGLIVAPGEGIRLARAN